MAEGNQPEIFFDEPRLRMTFAGRALARLLPKVGYGVLSAAAAVFSLTSVPEARSVGFLLSLFLLHRIWRAEHPESNLEKPLPRSVNAARYLSPQSYRLLEIAYGRASVAGGDVLLHLASRLVENEDVAEELSRLDVDAKEVIPKADEYLRESLARASGRDDVRRDLERLVIAAFEQARRSQGTLVEPHDLFAALGVLGHPPLQKLFELFDITREDLTAVFLATHLRERARIPKVRSRLVRGIGPRRNRIKHRVMNRAWTARPTPTLDRFSADLTDLARAGAIGALVGHGDEYRELVSVLARPGNPHALLVGESSAEAEAMVGELARHVVSGDVPPPLYDRRLVSLSLGTLVAGAAEGELERRLNVILGEIRAAGNVIAFIPEMHNLMRTAGGSKMSAADIFVPAIKRGDFSVVGATSPRDHKQYLDRDREFVESFEIIRLKEISEAEAAELLILRSILLEAEYRMTISLRAIREAVSLAHKFLRDKILPESADDLLKEAVAAAAEQRKKTLTAEEVRRVVEQKTKIPVREAGAGEAERLLKLEELIHERYIDQEEAVKAVAQSLREYRAGLSRKGGPIASFLFVGPTGVGKTELAKLLAKYQFGSESLMLRFDMSEYQEKQSLDRLIGSPDGAVRGALTDAVHDQPYSLVLLDEFEKAHPDLLNLFLQVLDDGRLTDTWGRVIDFQNTIIIATSNAHSDIVNEALSKSQSMAEIAEYLKRRLVDVFKPELLNRFSSVIAFKNLSPADVRAIARIKMAELAETLKDSHGIEFRFDEAVTEQIAKVGFDPVFGARPLRKAVEEHLRAPLASMILKKEVARGDTLRASLEGETIKLEVIRAT